MKNILNLSINKLVSLSTLFFLVSIFLIFEACENPDLSELKTGKSDLFDTDYTDTTSITLRTILESPVRSDELTTNIIGAYKDNVVGSMKASVLVEFKLPSDDVTVEFEKADMYKSVQLVLKLDTNHNYFGDINENLTLRIYQLMENIDKDEEYYSDKEILYNPTEIGTYTGSLNPFDTALIIDLTDAFGNELFSQDDTTFEEHTSFANYMKGLAIIPDDPLNKGWIGHFMLDLSGDKSYIQLNSDSSSFKFPVSSLSERIAKYDHNLTGSEVENQIIDSTNYYDKVILKPMAGTKVRVNLPYLKNYIDSGMIAIHKAELVFVQDSTSDYITQAPIKLFLHNTNAKNENLYLIDRIEGDNGGIYDTEERGYSITVTRHLQLLLKSFLNDPTFEEFGFNLTIPTDPVTSAPLILLQKDANGKQVTKLKLHYTRL